MSQSPDRAAADGEENPFAPPVARPARPARVVAAGPIPWGAALAVALGSGWAGAIGWSLAMSLVPGQEFGRVVASSGTLFGGGMGLWYGFQHAFGLRPARLILAAPDGADFLARVDAAIRPLGHRPLAQGAATRRYGARGLFRSASSEIVVQVADGRATLAGPMSGLKALHKRLAG